jgi:hypothetical protein
MSNAERDARSTRRNGARDTRARSRAAIRAIPRVRHRYSASDKCRVLDVYDAFQGNPNVRWPFMETCRWAFGDIWVKRKAYLRRWLDQADSIRAMASAERFARRMADPFWRDRYEFRRA